MPICKVHIAPETEQEIKRKRQLSYLMNEFDDVNLPYVVDYHNIAETVIDFFKTESKLIYPAKSYFVAIIYAYLGGIYFNQNFYVLLNYEHLLPDDRFFVPYLKDKATYDKIIEAIDPFYMLHAYESIKTTEAYFKQEFLLNGTDN